MDDGVGPEVARRVGAKRPWVTILTAHQLLPEHAEAISAAERVIFVDATAVGEPGEITIGELWPDPTAELGRLHDFGPQTLLAYADLLYGAAPPATLVTIGGYSFGHGESLSGEMEARLGEVETAVEGLLGPAARRAAPQTLL